MLLELKQTSEEDVQIESDLILGPLLGTLDESFELFSQSAEKTVLKRILKSLSYFHETLLRLVYFLCNDRNKH